MYNDRGFPIIELKLNYCETTEYNQSFCEELVKYCENGGMPYEWGCDSGKYISPDVVSKWRADYPEFDVAFRIAVTCTATYYRNWAKTFLFSNDKDKKAALDYCKSIIMELEKKYPTNDRPESLFITQKRTVLSQKDIENEISTPLTIEEKNDS